MYEKLTLVGQHVDQESDFCQHWSGTLVVRRYRRSPYVMIEQVLFLLPLPSGVHLACILCLQCASLLHSRFCICCSFYFVVVIDPAFAVHIYVAPTWKTGNINQLQKLPGAHRGRSADSHFGSSPLSNSPTHRESLP